ncbi:MAG: hypothetical protein K2Q18_00390, partial [Bdellovibrionales bacterium]|nr:hypothetical protein [Bdellovibrionales bacterium]
MIKIKKEDLEWASNKGIIQSVQVEPLWDALNDRPELGSKFDLTNVIYYFGGLLIIFGMAWFTNEAWEKLGGTVLFLLALAYTSIFTFIAYYLFHKKNLQTAGGIIATASVSLVALTIFGFQKMTGIWPEAVQKDFSNYHT